MSFSVTKIPRITVQYLKGPNGLPLYITDPTVNVLATQLPVWLQIRIQHA